MLFSTRTGFLLGAICLLYSTQASAKKCLGITTPEIEACQKEDLQQVEVELNRYTIAAEGGIRKSDDPEHALVDFRLAQEHWKQYRDTECKAAFENWSGGTIRVSMELGCRQRLTESRIFDIWQQWLTYPDSTPPILPKPNFSNRR